MSGCYKPNAFLSTVGLEEKNTLPLYCTGTYRLADMNEGIRDYITNSNPALKCMHCFSNLERRP